jgi:hypothetical protein
MSSKAIEIVKKRTFHALIICEDNKGVASLFLLDRSTFGSMLILNNSHLETLSAFGVVNIDHG